MKDIYLNGTIKCIAPMELILLLSIFYYKGFAPTEQ